MLDEADQPWLMEVADAQGDAWWSWNFAGFLLFAFHDGVLTFSIQ